MKLAIITTIILSCLTVTTAQLRDGFMTGYITRNIYRSVKKSSNKKNFEGILYYKQCKHMPDFPKIQLYCSAEEIISYITSNYETTFVLSLRNIIIIFIIYAIPAHIVTTFLWGSNRDKKFLYGLLLGMLIECIININFNKQVH